MLGYNKLVNPDNLKVKLGIALIDLRPHEADNILNLQVWMRYYWKDNRFRWSPEDYGGVDVIRLPSEQLWKPDITLFRTSDEVNRMNCWKQCNSLLYSTGEVLFVPPCKLSIPCNFTLDKDPFGEQHCELIMGSWTYEGDAVALDFWQRHNMDLSDYTPSAGFKIVSTAGEMKTVDYNCCPEPYVHLAYNITFKKMEEESR